MMGKSAPFTVDTRRAGSAPLDVQVNDNRGESVDVSMVDNKDGTFNCSYKPLAGSKHTVQVSVSN
jgi:filamin